MGLATDLWRTSRALTWSAFLYASAHSSHGRRGKGPCGGTAFATAVPVSEGLDPVPTGDSRATGGGWHDAALPVGISAVDVQRLLDGCDRNSPGGVRDFAILTLVARLGLRSAEVARLELGDIDWRAGELVVRGKARRQDRLPLPSDVGEALSAYLVKHDLQHPFGRCSWRGEHRRDRFVPIWSATLRAGRAIG